MELSTGLTEEPRPYVRQTRFTSTATRMAFSEDNLESSAGRYAHSWTLLTSKPAVSDSVSKGIFEAVASESGVKEDEERAILLVEQAEFLESRNSGHKTDHFSRTSVQHLIRVTNNVCLKVSLGHGVRRQQSKPVTGTQLSGDAICRSRIMHIPVGGQVRL